MRFVKRLPVVGFFIMVSIYSFSYYEKPMVIVIPSYNNSAWVEKNLSSVFRQKYDNYRVVYIDDASTDDTVEKVVSIIKRYNKFDCCTLIKNESRRWALYNHYKAVHSCQNDEIIVNLDGDDWFAHDNVLQRINAEYQDPDVWMTYGQYKSIPDNKIGISKEMPDSIVMCQGYREYTWITSAVRTFYAGLFKRICLKDLLYRGTFFPVTCDMAFMFPMLEMAAGRIAFIPDVLYIYNCKTGNNDFKKRLQLQKHTEHIIRANKRYIPLDNPPYANNYKRFVVDDGVALCIFFQGDKSSLDVCLASFEEHVLGVTSWYLISMVDDEDICKKIEDVYPNLCVVSSESDDLKSTIMKMFELCQEEYVALVTEHVRAIDWIDIRECVRLLEQTKAYGFYPALSYHAAQQMDSSLCVALEKNVYAWQFQDGEYEWRMPHTLSFGVYKKSRLQALFEYMQPHYCNNFERLWNYSCLDLSDVGLCYSKAKVCL